MWKMRPVTLNHWLNLLTSTWDVFAETDLYLKSVSHDDPEVCFQFRETNQQSYNMYQVNSPLLNICFRYRETCQIVDAISLVHLSKDFQGGMLVAGVLYIVLILSLGLFSTKEVVKYFSGSSLYLLDDSIEFNNTFGKFVKACFKIEREELIPFIQYGSKFFDLTMDNSLPPACKDPEAFEVSSLLFCIL